MNVLFDTNILIRITDVRTPMPKEVSDMLHLMNCVQYRVVYHPVQLSDFNRDSDAARKEINVTRLRQYLALEHPPCPSNEELKRLCWQERNDNDHVDNSLLYSVVRKAVGFLVTEDLAMHRKARAAKISEQVFSITAFVEYLSDVVRAQSVSFPAIVTSERIHLYELDLRNTFFDSLRADYPEFDQWFGRVAQEREAWVVRRENNIISGLCIFKIESADELLRQGVDVHGKVLKLCTFKVAERGSKYGEAFLKQAFSFAVENDLTAIYVQVRKNAHTQLTELLQDFGFAPLGKYRNDIVWVKMMMPVCSISNESAWKREDLVEYDIQYYPRFIACEPIQKFLVPIHPSYHEELFPDASRGNLFTLKAGFPFPSEGNAIKKAYISHSGIRKMCPGDLVFFYRTGDAKVVDTIGFVERTVVSCDVDEVLSVVARRTVLSGRRIRQMVEEREVLIVLFRFLCHLSRSVTKLQMIREGLSGEIQTIREMPIQVYRNLFAPILEGRYVLA